MRRMWTAPTCSSISSWTRRSWPTSRISSGSPTPIPPRCPCSTRRSPRIRSSFRRATSNSVCSCKRKTHPTNPGPSRACGKDSRPRSSRRSSMQTDITINAGVIEGFFGKPWDWPERLTCIDFLRNYGYRFYIYAPKADPFLRRRWREPLPAQTLLHLAELGDRCRTRGLSLGIGLSPFEIYLNYDAAAQASLRAKVEQINDIGAGLLCILFDDMRGDVDGLPDLQAKVVADICAWSEAERFIVCPTYYSSDPLLARAFGCPPKSYLRDFGRLIDADIDIFWSGEKVISDGYSAVHLSDVAAEIGREPFIWDNHISNNSKMRNNHMYLE